MYLPLKAIYQHKGIPARRVGVWLGVSERIEETLVGTKNGVITCRAVNRLNEADRCNRENVLDMKGTPCERIPGKTSPHIPVDVADDGECMGPGSENEDLPTTRVDDEAEERDFKIGMDKLHLPWKAIKESGETAGCPACDIIRQRGGRPGRIGRHHSEACRRRILDMMREDPECRHLAKRYLERTNGDDTNNENNLGNLTANTKQRHHTQQHNKCADKVETAKLGNTMHDWAQMHANVKKAVAQLENNIRKQTDIMAGQTGTNLGSQINDMMLTMLTKQMQVTEAYSPPRVAEMANKMGMRGGWSLDLTACDTDGAPWGFNSNTMRNRATKKFLNGKPLVLIGSPMCTEYSTMNRINHC